MSKKRKKGLTSGVNREELLRLEFIRNALIIKDKEGKVLNGRFITEVEAAASRFRGKATRYERAYRYNQWRQGKEVTPAIPFALVYDRTALELMTQRLNSSKVSDGVRYGVEGPSFDIVDELLEVTE